MKSCLFLAVLLAASAPTFAAPTPIARSQTPRGTLVLAQTDRTAPRVAISLVVRAGAGDESTATAGWRRLLVDAMLLGTRDPQAEGEVFLSGTQLRERVEALGGRLSAQVGDDAIEMSITGPSSRAVSLLELLMAVATRPRLSDVDVDRARRSLLRRLSDEEPADGASGAGEIGALGGDFAASARALRRLEERLYRDASGAPVAYGLSPSGTLQSLSNLDALRLREMLRQYFAPARRVLSLAGDVDLGGLKARAAQLEASGEWSVAPEARPAFAPISPTVPSLDVMEDVAKDKDPIGITRGEGPAASVFVSYPVETGALSPREVASLQVLASALGQSTRGRLSRRLLDVRRTFGDRLLSPGVTGNPNVAFASSLTAQWVLRGLRSEFVLWAQTGPQQIEAVKNVLLNEMKKIRDSPISTSELAVAKAFVRGAYFSDRELLRERASRNALDAARGLSGNAKNGAWVDEVAKLNAGDVQRAARKYLRGYAVALVMPSGT